MLRDATEYHDLGVGFFDQHDRTKTINRLRKRFDDLGYLPQPQPQAA